MKQKPVLIKEKPWGREIWFAHIAGYAGKILEVNKGCRLSLQYHEKKTETQYLFSGKIILTIGTDKKNLRKIVLKTGDKQDIFPYTIHRIEALEDSKIFEVSTDELEDVVRIEDDYNRPKKGNDEKLDRKLSKKLSG
jgi:quercetin dioxygenase-like cupin family protein